MSYNNTVSGTGPYAIHFKLASDTSVTSGNAVPYALVSGTTGHGLTVSSGVVSLPDGEWMCSFTLEANTSNVFTAQIYVDSTAVTDFPKIEAKSSSTSSNLDSTAIVLSGGVDIEIRPNTTLTYNAASDLLIFGVKT